MSKPLTPSSHQADKDYRAWTWFDFIVQYEDYPPQYDKWYRNGMRFESMGFTFQQARSFLSRKWEKRTEWLEKVVLNFNMDEAHFTLLEYFLSNGFSHEEALDWAALTIWGRGSLAETLEVIEQGIDPIALSEVIWKHRMPLQMALGVYQNDLDPELIALLSPEYPPYKEEAIAA
jgi:hypothetical protein